MLINGKTFDQEKVEKNTIYVIRKKRLVRHIESQGTGDEDIVNILFDLQDDQYGVYVKEYRPGFITESGCKKADILGLVIDENQAKFSSWIFDVKVTVGGEDVIFKLIEQLIDSYKHKCSITSYFAEFEECEHLGFITRDYQIHRIESSIMAKEDYIKREKEYLTKMPKTSIYYKKQALLLTKDKEVELLKDFLKGNIIINGLSHSLECYYSLECEGENICDLCVCVS